MKLRPRDVVSYQGRDWLIEGVCTYKVSGKAYPLARAVEGEDVRYIEGLMDDADDRVLMLHQIADLETSTPPPPSISYQGRIYVPKLSGSAQCQVAGNYGGRAGGTCELWRYRASGDLYLQIERWSDQLVVLAGESVHKDMIDVLPAG